MLNKLPLVYILFFYVCLASCTSAKREITQVSSQPCSVVFGGAKAHANKNRSCVVEFSASMDPVLVKWPLGKSLGKDELVELDFLFNSFTDMNGIELRLFNGTNINQFLIYKAGFFAQESFNFLQSNAKTKMSMGLGHFQGESKGSYDTLGIYVQPKSAKEFSLTLGDLSVVKKSFFGKGVVSITFDDGYESLLVADQILKPQGLSATAYIIFEALNRKSYVTKDDVCTLSKNGWAISSHATVPYTQTQNLDKFLKEDVANMRTLCKGALPIQHVAYPLGEHSTEIINIVKKYYSSARLAAGGLETLPPVNPYKLRAVNVTPGLSPQEIVKMAEDAIQSGDWLILMFHYIVSGAERNDLEYSSEKLKLVAAGLKKHKGQVKTVPQVIQK